MNVLKRVILAGTLLLIGIVSFGCHPEQRRIMERRSAIDLYGEATKLEEEHNYQEALDLLLQAAELSPRPAVFYHIGHCYRMLGEKMRAREYLQRALDSEPDYTLARMELDEIERSLQVDSIKDTASEKLYSPAGNDSRNREITASEKNKSQNVNLQDSEYVANVEFIMDEDVVVAESEETSRMVAHVITPSEASPGQPEEKSEVPSYNEAKKVLFPKLYGKERERIDKEIEQSVEKSVNLDDPLHYHYEKGNYYKERKLWREAVNEYRLALDADPAHAGSILGLAEVYEETDEYEKARTCFEEGLQTSPDDVEMLFEASVFFLKQQKYDRAITLLERMENLQPDNPKVHNNLGIAWLRKERFALAEQSLTTAIEKDPTFVKGYFNLGILYDRYIKDMNKALQMYKRYIELKGEKADLAERWIREIEAKQAREKTLSIPEQ